jgi:methylglutaconyl-CoA hydratase
LAELDAAVDATVKDLLAGGPNAQREIKQLFAQLAPGPITPEVRDLTAQTISRVRSSDEARQGFAAYLAKRPAPWSPGT